jgi:class 3 adenylate cyclase/tetratricopeptide (TPR) repeat protein
MRCPDCGQENPEGFRFCGACGSELVLAPAVAREERKVVTVLFADLVGFTSRAERMDPEDVRALLGPYHERLRSELERFGGTVEKFIGDAVMALFGAPVAHEDDPERAVRAALEIRDWVREEEDLQVRIAVTTGEALIALDARPEAGEGMASGDVVNTTARLQSAAPVNGVLVGEMTYLATRDAIDYGEQPAVEAKGKSERIPVWEALQARSGVGVDLLRDVRTPLVGRDRELDALRNALARVRAERTPQLVTLVGVPGIGKSRLVYELMQIVERDAELIRWRQGRSLPYGEGVSFWPIAEIVKAEAGLLEGDGPEEAQAKLRRAVEQVADGDAEWVEGHLRRVMGLEQEESLSGGDRRAEAFAAWRRYFEGLADEGPLVLVFEDLHWADDGTLDFVDHLVDWASGVPIFVIGTSRPELLERRLSWGGGKPNALTLALTPLSDAETAKLVSQLSDTPVLDAEEQQRLLAHAGGNPLYAEQLVRMLRERGRSSEEQLPETVQGIIAARLDGLSPEEKRLLQDAAVVGKVFWSGIVATLGDEDSSAATELLHGLERKEFVQRARRSSVAGETEYAFRHVLVRDVAYGQIPRAARSEKHLRAAEWIESLSRADDHAEMVAHHYGTALEYARRAGLVDPALHERTRVALRDAGDRAMRLHALGAARRFYEAALQLCEPNTPGRPELLLAYGKTLPEEVGADETILEEAHEQLVAVGNLRAAAEAQVILTTIWWTRGRRDRVRYHLDQALDLVREDAPSPSKAYVVANAARYAMLAGEYERAITVGAEALQMAEDLGLEELRGFVLARVGTARVLLGDRRGVEELERSIEILSAINSVESWGALLNLHTMHFEEGDLDTAWALHEQSCRLAERFGYEPGIEWERGERATYTYVLGRWDEAAALADDFLSKTDAGMQHYLEGVVRNIRGHIRLARGDAQGARDDARRQLEHSRAAAEPQVLHVALAFHAWMLFEDGREQEAREVADELLDLWEEIGPRGWSSALELAWILLTVGDASRYLALLDRQPRLTRWFEAARCAVVGEDVRCAEICAEIGTRPDEAYARLRAAKRLTAEGSRAEADAHLQKALSFYRSVGATRYIREGEALLAAAS